MNLVNPFLTILKQTERVYVPLDLQIDLNKIHCSGNLFSSIRCNMVPRKGLEPPHLAMSEPKSDASTNFATWAFLLLNLVLKALAFSISLSSNVPPVAFILSLISRRLTMAIRA